MLKIEGLDEFEKSLDALAARADELSKTTSVPLAELLTPEFLAANTTVASLEQFFESGGLRVDSSEDLEAVPAAEMDTHVRSVSAFQSWGDMLQAAGNEWAARKLGLSG